MKKLGFFGAMNRDVVVQRPAAPLLAALGVDAPLLIETAVSDGIAQRGATLANELGAVTWLGGSAFNSARVAALLDEGNSLDLAFFGLAGTVGSGQPHVSALREWGVATDAVDIAPQPPATCLAVVEPAGRTLLTALGANAGIAAFLRGNRVSLVEAIAGRDLVHVTSYLDPEAPGLIAELLAEARRLNPGLLVSLDPGAAWVMPGGPGFRRLLAETNILHLNTEEFGHLCGPDPRPKEVLALLNRLHPHRPMVVARTHIGAAIHRLDATGQSTSESLPDTPLPAQVRDATGAGDTFCGAFLCRMLADPNAPLEAARLGFAMARVKIALDGPLTRAAARAVTKVWEGW